MICKYPTKKKRKKKKKKLKIKLTRHGISRIQKKKETLY